MAKSMYRINYKGLSCLVACVMAVLSGPAVSVESFDRKEICTVRLSGNDVNRLQEAIEDLYYFEFVYGVSSVPRRASHPHTHPHTLTDEIPIRGFIGHLEEGSFLPHNHKTFLWSHLHFTFEYNEKQVGSI